MKPPYRLPTMAEIAAIEPNGLAAVSTFSGAGGSTLGLRTAGYRVLYASEFIEAARDVYRRNHPTPVVDDRDIREVTPDEILEAIGLERGELDLLEGSPPCSSFSTAGKREKGWGSSSDYSDGKQRTDDLFFEFARILEGLRPRAFVAENVTGLVRGTAKGYYKLIRERLRAAGYRVKATILNAAYLGVPQARERLIFVGFRDDLDLEPVFPTPLPYAYTIRDALPEISDATVDDPTVEPEAWMHRHATGRAWRAIGGIGQSERYFQLVRPDPSLPCPTITAAGGNPGLASVAHPYACRKFSLRELRLLSSFPADFRLSGSYAQGYERIGRSVPPRMMEAVAREIAKELLA